MTMLSRTVVASPEVILEKIKESKFIRSNDGVILPNQDFEHFVDVNPGPYKMAVERKIPMELAFIFEYTHSQNMKGEYGLIATYNHQKKAFVLKHEWVK